MNRFNQIKQYGVELHEDAPTTSTPICKMIPSVIDAQYAQLFKAAPDMYEVLKVLLNTYWLNQGNDGKTCPHPGEFIACITPTGIPDYWIRAKEVLSKVEGK